MNGVLLLLLAVTMFALSYTAFRQGRTQARLARLVEFQQQAIDNLNDAIRSVNKALADLIEIDRLRREKERRRMLPWHEPEDPKASELDEAAWKRLGGLYGGKAQ